jgi:hypothetical protein
VGASKEENFGFPPSKGKCIPPASEGVFRRLKHSPCLVACQKSLSYTTSRFIFFTSTPLRIDLFNLPARYAYKRVNVRATAQGLRLLV